MLPRIHTLTLRMSLAYLIEANSGLILIDAGIRGEEKFILKEMNGLGRDDLRLIFITHAHLDHYGSAAALRRITGAPIAIHQQDFEPMSMGETRLGSARNLGRAMAAFLPVLHPLLKPEPVIADSVLQEGDTLAEYGLEARILHTPGHTAGSSCLLVQDRLAFSGDLVTSSRGVRLQRYFAQEWSILPESLGRLQAQQPEWIYPGHGREPIRGEELQAL